MSHLHTSNKYKRMQNRNICAMVNAWYMWYGDQKKNTKTYRQLTNFLPMASWRIYKDAFRSLMIIIDYRLYVIDV